ncbi:MAG: hypothetical protein ACE5F9_14725 [Phycisphaerae bacterium]
MKRRIALNPCDCLIYGHHRFIRRQRAGGNIPYMNVELDGPLDPTDAKAALAGALSRHPAVMAPLCSSPTRLRPFWRLPPAASSHAERAADRAYVFDDLTDSADWPGQLDQRWHARCGPDWDLRRGPQVRLEHYALPTGKTRLCLRWPHCLMDAAGAQWFLAEIGRAAADVAKGTPLETPALPDALTEDDQEVNVLAGRGLVERLRLMRHGWTAGSWASPDSTRTLANLNAGPLQSYRVIHRQWDAAVMRSIHAKANAVTPPGPARYARHLAACVIHALHRLHVEQGIPTPAYRTTFPLTVADDAEDPSILRHRPLIGNYLVSPGIALLDSQADDLGTIGQALLRQLEDFRKSHGGLMQWAALWWASLMHTWTYGLIFRWPRLAPSFNTGFSYYGEIAEPFRTLFGARVTNLWGGGPTTVPPGWNPVFSRFDKGLNLSLTYSRPAIRDPLAHRYVELIERAMFGMD